MGTNYYVARTKATLESPIHIGKASAGWLFLFQTQNEIWHDPPIVWNTYEQVKEWLRKNVVESGEYAIVDEYDCIVTYDEFCERVNWRQNDEHCLSNKDNFVYARNVDGYRFSDDDFR